jgi:predicted Zn-dependent protease
MSCSCCATRPLLSPDLTRRHLLVTAAATAGVTLAGCAEFGDLGASFVDREQVQSLGLQAYEEIKEKTPIYRNAQAQALVERVGRRVVQASGSTVPANQWEFTLFDSEQLNAFALPGGKIGVYRGMLEFTGGNEAQLATVLAHEAGHVTADHAAERLGTTQLTGLGATALGMVLEAYGIPAGAQASGLAADLLVARPFSRGQELEADRLGLNFMARAGYDPATALTFWQRMAQASGRAGSPAFLSTHPADAARIAQIEQLLPEAERTYRATS